jgi:hypothetical protein
MIELADEKLIGTRMAICLGCKYRKDNFFVGDTCGPFLNPQFDAKGNKLTCGCVLKLKWKLLNYHCDQRKW